MAPESNRDQCNKEGCRGCRHCNGSDYIPMKTRKKSRPPLSGYSNIELQNELSRRKKFQKRYQKLIKQRDAIDLAIRKIEKE